MYTVYTRLLQLMYHVSMLYRVVFFPKHKGSTARKHVYCSSRLWLMIHVNCTQVYCTVFKYTVLVIKLRYSGFRSGVIINHLLGRALFSVLLLCNNGMAGLLKKNYCIMCDIFIPNHKNFDLGFVTAKYWKCFLW